jgi:RNA polymerase sigma-70 factor (ECF subfamily)
MPPTPETRHSLLVRLQRGVDQEAWQEFVKIYRPVILRMARHKGLQHADAEDLAQQVLLSVAAAIGQWRPDAERAKFRTWLARVAHNRMINMLARGNRADRGSGDTDVKEQLDQQPTGEGPDSRLLALEFRRQVFRWAAEKIESEFHVSTWQAFWRTTVERQSIEEVARQQSMSPGAVYAARSRVMRRLKEQVKQFDDGEQVDKHGTE